MQHHARQPLNPFYLFPSLSIMSHLALLKRLRSLEQVVNYREPPPQGEPPFAYEPGKLPVLISAPHGAAHMRNGQIKREDGYTTGFARLVAAETGAHVLYATHLNALDPNWYERTPYKDWVQQIIERHQIRFVLDLHGMRDKYKIGLALGTMNGRSCPEHEPLITQTLQAQGFTPITQKEATAAPRLRWNTVVLNHKRFTGGLANHTVTRFVAETMRVPAVQVELCSAIRIVEQEPHDLLPVPVSYYGNPAAIEQGVRGLTAVVRSVGR